MDNEQQIRLNFLDEAQGYFDRMEETFLNSAAIATEPERLDAALRAAHSIKGGAAMMGFTPLSQTAHRLEDFLKVLRVRPVPVDAELETLFLQGVDALRAASDRHRRDELSAVATWLTERTVPLFRELQARLGDLRPEDDDALLAQEEEVDVASLMFESGVADCLERFAAQLEGNLTPTELQAETIAVASELAEFGRMQALENFVALCSAVGSQVQMAAPAAVPELAQQALATWQRSHSLVVLGRVENIPSQFIGSGSAPQAASNIDSSEMLELPDLDDLELDELTELQSEVDDMATGDLRAAVLAAESLELMGAPTEPLELEVEPFAELDAIELDTFDDLEDLPGAVSALEVLEQAAEETSDRDIASISFDEVGTPKAAAEIAASSAPPIELAAMPQSTAAPRIDSEATVRVSAEQLRRVSNLFGQLVLERNAINLRLGQLQRFVQLMQERMLRLEQSNGQLRKWYDRASVEGLLGAAGNGLPDTGDDRGLFDSLEMDRYGELHPIAQEQMETIVQLQEVAADINLGLQEMEQATGSLDRTTRDLQRGITRTQMRPFSDAVSRFPRVVRDLAVQYGKQVDLQLDGETVLLDRLALEALADPLNHLLRNAFDHGIEAPAVRQAAGKPARGTIAIVASNRGNQTIVTISDDGQGIAFETIRARVMQMGLSAAEVDQLGDRELLEFIFEPGFSTAERVTELSGRGVGMDVVRTNLQNIRGDIRVETRPGQGTTFTISIPQSLSILEVAILEAAGMVFAIPSDAVKEVTDLVDCAAESMDWNGEELPILRLERWFSFGRSRQPFEMDGTPKIDRPTVVAIGETGALQGLHVERFWGQQEVTIRAIDSPVAMTPGVVGATLLGDGRAIPLLDPLRLLAWIGQQDAPSAEAQLAAKQVPQENSTEQERTTILIADDSINVRRYLALALEREGYQIEQAKDGREATDKIFSNPAISAVICDIEMPHLDGYDVLSEVRAREEFRDLPIAMLTSRSSEKHRKLAMNLGASAYFSKPYNEQELLQTLAQLVAASVKSPVTV